MQKVNFMARNFGRTLSILLALALVVVGTQVLAQDEESEMRDAQVEEALTFAPDEERAEAVDDILRDEAAMLAGMAMLVVEVVQMAPVFSCRTRRKKSREVRSLPG